MALKLVKKLDQYSIYIRGDERYAVKDAKKQPVNGEEKVRILVEADLLKAALTAKPAAEAPGQPEPDATPDSAESAESA